MKYDKIAEALFLERPNRFTARVLLNGKEETVHVKNTGRCRELLLPGRTRVYLEDCREKGNRKTGYSLIAAEKGARLINMDSQAPNQVVEEWLKADGMGPLSRIVRERTYGKSRFDFYYERENGISGYLEVKGVTLEKESIALFPDAPTERGVKHVEELIQAGKEGYEAGILFAIQMKGVKQFVPNWATHPDFGRALCKAAEAGVNILAYDCQVTADSLSLAEVVPVCLEKSIFEKRFGGEKKLALNQ